MLVFGLGLIGGGIGVLVYFRDELRVLPPVRRWILPALRRWVRPALGRWVAGPVREWVVPWLQGWVLPWLPLGGLTRRSRPRPAVFENHSRPVNRGPGAGSAGRAVGRASPPAETAIRPLGGRPPGSPRVTGRASPPPSALPQGLRERSPGEREQTSGSRTHSPGGWQPSPPAPRPRPHRTDHT